MLILNCLYLD